MRRRCALLLLLGWLAPGWLLFARALSEPAESCQMQCCRAKQKSCCKKREGIKAGRGENLRAQPECGGRCGQPAVASARASGVVPVGEEFAPVLTLSAASRLESSPHRAWSGIRLSSLQRPPPARS